MRRTRKRETHLDGPHLSRCATSVAPEPITPDPRLRTTVDQSVVNGGVSRAHPAHLAGAPFRLGTFRWHPPAAARDSDRKQAKDANRAGRRSIRERRGSGDGDRRVVRPEQTGRTQSRESTLNGHPLTIVAQQLVKFSDSVDGVHLKESPVGGHPIPGVPTTELKDAGAVGLGLSK